MQILAHKINFCQFNVKFNAKYMIKNLNTKFILYCANKTNLKPLNTKYKIQRLHSCHNYNDEILAFKFLQKSKILDEKLLLN